MNFHFFKSLLVYMVSVNITWHYQQAWKVWKVGIVPKGLKSTALCQTMIIIISFSVGQPVDAGTTTRTIRLACRRSTRKTSPPTLLTVAVVVSSLTATAPAWPLMSALRAMCFSTSVFFVWVLSCFSFLFKKIGSASNQHALSKFLS